MRTARQKTLQDLYTNGALADASEKSVLVLEGSARSCNLVKNIEVHASQVAGVLPVAAYLAFEMEEGNLVCGHAGSGGDLWTKELGRRPTTASARADLFGTFPEGTNNTFIQRFDAVLLVLTDTGLRSDYSPQLQDVILHLLDVYSGDGVSTGHLLDISFQLANILPDDFGVDNITFLRDFGMRSSGECYWFDNVINDDEYKSVRMLTIFVHWRMSDHFFRVVDELLAKLFGKNIGITLTSVATVDVVLHISEKFGVGAVE